MKKAFLWVVCFIAIFIVYDSFREPINGAVYRLLYYSPCDSPIQYRLGTVDERFHISTEQLQTDIDQAVAIWDEAAGTSLFAQDPSGMLSINLVYDDRQLLKTQIEELDTTLHEEKNTLSEEERQYESLSALFQKELNDFNERVQYWNTHGGAPSGEYEKLISEQEQLRQQAAQLKEMAEKLNRSGEGFNSRIDTLNQTIDTFNQEIGARPEEGVYDQNFQRIDIYFVQTHEELVHTIAHELGHALGLDHVSNPESIMYPLTSQTLLLTPEDREQIKTICQKRTIFEVFFRQLEVRLKILQEKLDPMLRQQALQ